MTHRPTPTGHGSTSAASIWQLTCEAATKYINVKLHTDKELLPQNTMSNKRSAPPYRNLANKNTSPAYRKADPGDWC